MTENLNILQQFVDEANASNSTTDKRAVLRKYKDIDFIKQVLVYTYSPFIQFNLTSKNCKKNSMLSKKIHEDLFGLLDDLKEQRLRGHSAIEAVNGFINAYSEYSDILYNIIDKNLKTRTDASLINAEMDGLIERFEVALALGYDEKTAKKVIWADGWYVSRKLDGLRCLAIIDEDGEVKMLSRNGKVFETLAKVIEEIKKLDLRNTVLDGEICIVDENGDEDFQAILKEWKRKDYIIENPKYKLFDCIPLGDFKELYSELHFSTRLADLDDLLDGYNGEILDRLEQVKVESDEHLTEWVTKASDGGWEGVMLRKDAPYQGKRSTDLLKVKKFHDAEYEIVDVEMGIQRVIVDGTEVEEEMLRNVIINHKGTDVSVGSGFSQEQRRHYYNHPEELYGAIITVKYFEETSTVDQNGNPCTSLRFPTVKAIYKDGKREV